jgi:hypothetical protein
MGARTSSGKGTRPREKGLAAQRQATNGSPSGPLKTWIWPDFSPDHSANGWRRQRTAPPQDSARRIEPEAAIVTAAMRPLRTVPAGPGRMPGRTRSACTQPIGGRAAGRCRHRHGRAADQSAPLSGRPVHPIRLFHRRHPGRPDTVRREHHLSRRRVAQAAVPHDRGPHGQDGPGGAVPGRRAPPDRQRRQRVRQPAGGAAGHALRGGRGEAAPSPAGGGPPDGTARRGGDHRSRGNTRRSLSSRPPWSSSTPRRPSRTHRSRSPCSSTSPRDHRPAAAERKSPARHQAAAAGGAHERRPSSAGPTSARCGRA